MGEELVKTGADTLIEYLEGKDKASVVDVAKDLKLPVDTLQPWVDFLVEEGVLGIEYKFTKPYIYINKQEKEKVRIVGEEELSWDTYHKAFLEKAKERHISDLKTAGLWKNHVMTKIDEKKAFFYDEARKRGFNELDKLWNEYKTEVLLKI